MGKGQLKKQRKKENKYNIDKWIIDASATLFQDTVGEYDNDIIRAELEKIMSYSFYCTCILAFCGQMSHNAKNISAYAKYKTANHVQHFKFYMDHLDEAVVWINISSGGEIKQVHERKTREAATYRILNGRERDSIKKNWNVNL